MKLELVEERVNKDNRAEVVCYSNQVDLYIDSETGVQYFVMNRNGQVGAICPRYNADGSLYVTINI